jgi:hypothetical protein
MNLEYGSHYFDCTLTWSGTDTVERWNEHNKKKKTREQLINLGYTDKCITYNYNEYGFRTENFHDKGNSIIFLGCSFTEGVGVRYKDTMANVVSKKLNLDGINLAVGGGANDTSFRIANYWIEKLKPSIVVFQPTDFSRLETFCEGHIPKVCVPSHFFYQKSWFANYFKNYLRYDENLKLNYDKNRLAIEQICQNNRIKFIQTYDGDLRDWSKPDVGRDLAHPGVKSHQHMADIILKKINEER